jgi:hypothetical protein
MSSTITSNSESRTLAEEYADIMARAKSGQMRPGDFTRLDEIRRLDPNLGGDDL